MASSTCPLCKSPTGADANPNPLPSRLCEQCRALLSTILPQAVAGSVVIVDAQKPSSQHLVAQSQIAIAVTEEPPVANHSAMQFEAQAQVAEPTLEPTPQPQAQVNLEPPPQPQAQGNIDSISFDSPPTFSTAPVYFHSAEKLEPTPAQVEEASQRFFIPAEEKFEAPYLQAAEKVEDKYVQAAEKIEEPYAQTEVDNHYIQAEEKSPYSFREPEFIEPPQPAATYVEQLEQAPEMPPQGGNFFAPPVANPFVAQENFQTQEAAPLYPQEAAPQHFYPPEAAPLYPQESVYHASQPAYQASQPVIGNVPPVWDETVDNYPVLMVQEEKRSLLKPLLAMAAMALIAVAAAGYWFVYKPYFSGSASNATQRAGANVEDNSPAAQPTKPEKSAATNTPTPAETPANAATTPATPADKPPEEAKTNLEGQTGQGKYSLQAASFPNEPAAKEFSEKLIRSGIPAYIASAEIAGKGRWFRVRVGRFMNPADAEKYATQAKQRIKATGLNLQLVICEYSNQ